MANETRLAEIAQELLGAKMLAKVVEDLFDRTDDDTKKKIADAIGVATLKRIQDTYDINAYLRDGIAKLVEEHLAANRETILQYIREKVDGIWQSKVDLLLEEDLKKMTSEITGEVRRKYNAIRH